MSTKTKAIIVIVVIAASYAFGRYSAPTKVITKTEVVTVEKKTDQTETHKNTHTSTTTTTTKKPDGTTETTTKTDTENRDTIGTKDTIGTTTTSSTEKEVLRDSSKITLSMLAGVSISSPTGLIYGGIIQRPLVGPVSVGLFGMANGVVGVSVGLQF